MHTDHKGFGPTVCTISLGDDWEMDFLRGLERQTSRIVA